MANSEESYLEAESAHKTLKFSVYKRLKFSVYNDHAVLNKSQT